MSLLFGDFISVVKSEENVEVVSDVTTDMNTTEITTSEELNPSLEKKVEAHNNLVERMTIVEQEEKSNEQRIQRLECEKYD